MTIILKSDHEKEAWMVSSENDHCNCSLCRICIHAYCCTCLDYFIQHTICKHIHSVAKDRNFSSSTPQPCSSNADIEVKTHLKTLSSSKSNTTESRQRLVDNILSETSKIQNIVSKDALISNDALKHLLKTLRKETLLLESEAKEGSTPCFTSEIVREPSNKEITKQITFFATKKERKLTTQHNTKPNSSQTEIMKDILLNKAEFISDSSNIDHNYDC
ncbi:hypothetical protein HUJ05_001765 [Dendroctonus ponderosae]|nr:hypothetical protein HUJ05_001765 [Dendroctonus ponderosae]